MAPRLRQQALARIDQDDGEIGGGGAGRHVAGVLLVAGRIGDDEAARLRREIAIGDVDGDALLALGREPVDQQSEIGRFALRTEFPGVVVERAELVVEDRAGLVEHAADQGRLAVIDGAAGDEAQQRMLTGFGRGWRVIGGEKILRGLRCLRILLGQVPGDGEAHQK